MARLTCKQTYELMTDAREGALGEVERDRFDEHLSACDHCKTLWRQLEETIAMLGALPRAEVPPPFEELVVRAFKRKHRPGRL